MNKYRATSAIADLEAAIQCSQKVVYITSADDRQMIFKRLVDLRNLG